MDESHSVISCLLFYSAGLLCCQQKSIQIPYAFHFISFNLSFCSISTIGSPVVLIISMPLKKELRTIQFCRHVAFFVCVRFFSLFFQTHENFFSGVFVRSVIGRIDRIESEYIHCVAIRFILQSISVSIRLDVSVRAHIHVWGRALNVIQADGSDECWYLVRMCFSFDILHRTRFLHLSLSNTPY